MSLGLAVDKLLVGVYNHPLMKNVLDFPNGISLHLDVNGSQFHGIGAVSYKGTQLRSSQLPWTVYTETEHFDEAVRFETFSLKEVREKGSEVELVITSKGSWMPRIQAADAMGEARIKARRVKAPEAEFLWRFRPITEKIYENVWDGLAMQIGFSCPGHPIHWLLETTTWEIGGAAAGCTLIQQDISTIQLEQAVEEKSAFSTIEKFFTEEANAWGGAYPMDMLPRAAGAAICDFQVKENTALCLFAEKPGMTRARLEKFSDENIVHYLDRAYFPLAEKVQAPERKLLVLQAPKALERHEVRNLWLDCFTEVRRRILANYNFELEVPQPCVGAHLWDAHLKERMAAWSAPLENDLAEYARMGFRQVFVHGVWESVTSDPHPVVEGNICSPYAFRYAEMFGGAAGMKKLNDTAQANGLRLMQWFSFHLSCKSPIWKKHPEWALREANGDPWDGNYGSLWSGRIRSEYRDWFMQQILDVKKDTGIEGIFWDSYQNLGVTGIDWSAPDKAPQADEIFAMQGELQRAGFRQRVEIVTIFGVSQVATFGFRNDKFRRRLWDDFVTGDQAFTMLDCSPAFFTSENMLTPDKVSPARYLWMAAHRSIPGLGGDPWGVTTKERTRFPGGDAAAEYARVNHLYNKALPKMGRLRLQPGGTHVLWLDEQGAPAVIWSFAEVIPAVRGTATDLETGAVTQLDGKTPLKANSAYSVAAL